MTDAPSAPVPLPVQDLPALLRRSRQEASRAFSDWWNVESSFEVLLGAVLVQNTSWQNVEVALRRLRDAGVRRSSDIRELDSARLAELISPAGFRNAKAQAIIGICQWWCEHVEPAYPPQDGIFARASILPNEETADLRSSLLAVKGIGRETADVILLYLLGRRVFVADKYAARLFHHLRAPVPRRYSDFARLVEDNVDLSLKGWQDFHADIDEYAKRYCRDDSAWRTGLLRDVVLVFPPGHPQLTG